MLWKNFGYECFTEFQKRFDNDTFFLKIFASTNFHIMSSQPFNPGPSQTTFKLLLLPQGQVPQRSSILVESQSIVESIPLADSGIHLVYHSARAKDYLSTIQLQLTPDEIPDSLLKVRIKITIEGVVHEKVFEADSNIRYTYAWDGLNEYRQVLLTYTDILFNFAFSQPLKKKLFLVFTLLTTPFPVLCLCAAFHKKIVDCKSLRFFRVGSFSIIKKCRV